MGPSNRGNPEGVAIRLCLLEQLGVEGGLKEVRPTIAGSRTALSALLELHHRPVRNDVDAAAAMQHSDVGGHIAVPC